MLRVKAYGKIKKLSTHTYKQHYWTGKGRTIKIEKTVTRTQKVGKAKPEERILEHKTGRGIKKMVKEYYEEFEGRWAEFTVESPPEED